ncbi:MAG TPA: ferritin-like domain-containing protein [Thermoanaerobaculia bacterium]|nr:ferritin-like domain-containing protein [Thermoanaerobaculia bacterium]
MNDDLALLIRQLRGAYSGELAAGYAYRGHWRSVRDAAERERIQTIEQEEWHHRELVGGLLAQLGAKPSRIREAIFFVIGKTIAAICHVGGRFIPMYGAGKLERSNIVEYEDAAKYAANCGHEEMVECLLMMADTEWEHERYFRECITGHPLLRVFRLWEPPPPKETIRSVERRASARRNGTAGSSPPLH